MIKIIRHGKNCIIYRCMCGTCGCCFECNESDIETHFGSRSWRTVKCPECTHELDSDSEDKIELL